MSQTAAGTAPPADTTHTTEGAGGPEGRGTLLTNNLPPADGGPGQGQEQGATPGNAHNKTGEAANSEGTDNPLAQVPASPGEYGLTFAKDVSVDTALLDTYRATAHELGLTRGQAQKLAELYAGHITGAETKQQAAMGAALKQAVDGWEKEITGSPGFEANKADAKRALAEFGSGELFQIMDDTLIGSHPAMFRFMAAVGKALGEPHTRGKAAGGGSLTAEKILYPNQK